MYKSVEERLVYKMAFKPLSHVIGLAHYRDWAWLKVRFLFAWHSYRLWNGWLHFLKWGCRLVPCWT
jgi:hypothetical protein